MPVTKGLGKGLSALFGEMPLTGEEQRPNLNVPIQKIEPNPFQPRKNFQEDELQTLADSIARHGMIQPLAVRPLENGFYQIIAGERRWRAARMAGLSEVPAIVLEVDDEKSVELALIENLQRQDLNPIEEAEGYHRLLTEYGLTQEQAAECVGKSRPAIANARRLLSLSQKLLDLIADGTLSAGHARAILSLPSEQEQMEAADKIIAQGLSVRQAEALCRNMARQKPETEDSPKILKVDYIAECEKNLSRYLGRGVRITNGKRKGHLDLEFYGPDDLQKLLELLEQLKNKEAV